VHKTAKTYRSCFLVAGVVDLGPKKTIGKSAKASTPHTGAAKRPPHAASSGSKAAAKTPGATASTLTAVQAFNTAAAAKKPAQSASNAQGTSLAAAGQPTAEAEGKAAARQRKKASDVSLDDAVKVVQLAHAQGSFAKVGLLELKAFLKAKGKPVSGKKAELVERAQAVLASQP
jgi:hypothetical protein